MKWSFERLLWDVKNREEDGGRVRFRQYRGCPTEQDNNMLRIVGTAPPEVLENAANWSERLTL